MSKLGVSDHAALNDPAAPHDNSLAKNALSLSELVFTSLACLAPLTLVIAVMPLHFLIGGSAVPGGFIVAGVVMILFGIGLTTMMKYVRNAGAFYAIITKGLGKEVGSAAAMVAVLAYNALQVSTYGAIGLYAGQTLGEIFGISAPWWLYAGVALLAVGFLGYRGIAASAKVLMVVLLCEMAALVILAFAIFVNTGHLELSAEPYAPTHVLTFQNGAMFGLVFGAFMGFESTAIYSEEVKGGTKTVRRATYIVVAFIAVFYSIMAFAIVTAYGTSGITDAATNHTDSLVTHLFSQYTGPVVAQIANVLLLFSAFAALLALHNASNRYVYALGREGLLPRRFGQTDPKTKSPRLAGTMQTIFAAVVILLCVIFNVDPYLGLLLWGSALGFLGIITLWALCSLAVVVYLRRNVPDAGLWRGTIAPLIAFVALTVVAVLVVVNFDLFSGGNPIVNLVVYILAAATAVAGVARALYLRSRRPETYAGLASTNLADAEDRNDR
jgi:amino acid transporter